MTSPFDLEECIFRGRVPLDVLKAKFESSPTFFSRLTFGLNGHGNDAVYCFLERQKTRPFKTLYEVTTDGGPQITNAGIKWLTKFYEGCSNTKTLKFNSCPQLSDDDLALLLKLTNLNSISMIGASLRHLSHPKLKYNVPITSHGCPILTREVKLVDLNQAHTIVVPAKGVSNSLVEFITTKKPQALKSFHQVLDHSINDWRMTFSELKIDHPMFDLLVTDHIVQAIITYDEKGMSADDVKKNVIPIIAKFVIKAAFTTDYPENQEVVEEKDEENGDSSEKKEEEKKKEEKDTDAQTEEYPRTFRECEFTLVQIGTNQNLSENLQKKMSEENLFDDIISEIEKSIKYHEEHLADMDTAGQREYAQLCTAKLKLETFNQEKADRMHFISIDMKKEEDVKVILAKVREIIDCRRHYQKIRYKIAEKFQKFPSIVLETVKKQEVLDMTSGMEEKLDITGAEFMQIARILHEQGKLVILQLCSKTLLVDIQFLKSIFDKIETFNPKTVSGSSKPICTALQTGGKELSWQTTASYFGLNVDEANEKFDILLKILQDYCGLVEIPVLRKTPQDQQFILTVPTSLSSLSAPRKLDLFYSKDKPADFVVMEKTYRFVYPVAKEVLSGLVTSAAKFGRTLMVTKEDAVFQLGSVQTVVKSSTSDGCLQISIQSKCYLPAEKVEPVNEDTEVYVREYTWNIFCLYTDMMEKILYQRKLVFITTGDVPKGLVNKSVGCKHVWKKVKGKFTQSICTMCNRCCENGKKCQYNGIMGDNIRECLCKTSSPGCVDCGICIDCAAELWEVRSYLRPNMTSANRSTVAYPTNHVESVFDGIPLDAVAYNEFEYQMTKPYQVGMFLQEVEDGSMVTLFPGPPLSYSGTEIYSKFREIEKDENLDPVYQIKEGDVLKFRITDPYRLTAKDVGDDLDFAEINTSKAVYTPSTRREMKISQETGLLCYEPSSKSGAVAQFVGPEIFSEKFRQFSIKVIKHGKKRTISVGVGPSSYSPNRHVGWDSTSYGYHADDGGLFMQRSSATKKSQSARCAEGDIMSVYCNMEEKSIKFYKNDKLMYEVPEDQYNEPKYGFRPIVCMNSPGECVRLLEKVPWTTRPGHTITMNPSSCFDTYKFGNMWISPMKNVIMRQKDSSNYLYGWIILHNPTKGYMAYKNTPGEGIANYEDYFTVGLLEPHSTQVFNYMRQSPEPEEVLIEWMALDSTKGAELSKTYSSTRNDIFEKMFKEAAETKKYSHRVNLVKQGLGSTSELLPTFEDSKEKETGFRLDVIKNSTLINSYLLKKGRYLIDSKSLNNSPEYIMKRPKCPTYLYPTDLGRGMKVITCSKTGERPDDYKFMEKVIDRVDEKEGIEFLPDGKDNDDEDENAGNVPKQLLTEEEVKVVERLNREKKKEGNILPYTDPKSNGSYLEKTYVLAPAHLITKGGDKVLKLYDIEWKKKALIAQSSCCQVITRPTVQEHIITQHAHHLLEWSIKDTWKPEMPFSIVYLPTKLDAIGLKYPVAMMMYKDVDVHKLCCMHDDKLKYSHIEMKSHHPKVKVTYDSDFVQGIFVQDGVSNKVYKLNSPKQTSVHFMAAAGSPPSKPVPVDYSYGNIFQAWNYVALLTHKLKLPSLDVLQGSKGDLSMEHAELLIYQLLQSYASLCGLYATQYGGLAFQSAPGDFTDWIKDLWGSETTIKEIQDMDDPSSDVFAYRLGNYLACRAHALAKADYIKLPKYSLESKLFKPYFNVLDTLTIRSQTLTQPIPSDLFKEMQSLRVITMVDVAMDNTEIPKNISTCKFLEIIVLSNIRGLRQLPKDMLCPPNLVSIYIDNCPIMSLDLTWPSASKMTSLTLRGLLIEKIPAGIGNLSMLEDLRLDYNPISTLPVEIEKLTNLKNLSVKGIPWLTLDGKFEQMSKTVYMNWHTENPYIKNMLSEEKVGRLFDEHDENSSNVIDKMQLVKLNTHFLFNIPRLGILSAGDKEFGGVPPGILKLKCLETLDLSYTAITCLPAAARNMQRLCTIYLDHCPLLDTIDGNVGLLPNLRAFHLNSCPSLDSPPQDIVGRGFEAVKSYLQKMAGGFTECHRTKLMFIGVGQAGKTTLLRALQSNNKKFSGSIPRLTDGIEIKEWKVPVEHDGRDIEITYSCWDFAGQTVYYNTHQFFLSKQAVYMLLWNMRMGFEHAGLDFWLSSIVCHCPDTPVIVVGTQLDQIPMPDIREDELMKKYPQIKKFCYVSSTQGTNIADLEKTLIDVTLNHCPQMTMKIPLLWLQLEGKILFERKDRKNILDFTSLVDISSGIGISDEQDIKMAIQFLDDLGIVQYFDTEVLNNKVVINPQWIVDVMAKVVSVNEKSIKENKGRFMHSSLSEVWKNYDPSLHDWLLKLTEAFDLTFPIPVEKGSEKFNIVPCLLPEKEPVDLPWPYLSEEEGYRESKIEYKFTYLPTGLFNRAQARLFSQGFTMDEEFLNLMWKRGFILKKNGHYALVKQTNDYEMVVLVEGARPKNILDLIHETISTLIKDSFEGVDYNYYIPCPDCVEKKEAKDPHLFKAELIHRAYNVNAPFLQCTKYFHTVSTGELLNALPDNKETEFDIQMQQSISALQEISTNMAKDVAIIYCPEDIPSNGKGVNPKEIYKDLKKAGFSCWFPEDMTTTTELEMTMEIKNAKVLVVCVSDQFVANTKCHKMFMYATEQLQKPFTVAVIRDSLDWMQTDIGMKIGNPNMAMIKNLERYPKKILDLITNVKDCKTKLDQGMADKPPVFISYCWTNSKDACSVTTEAKPGSLGYGDPREIKKHLEKNGMRCWLDIEQLGRKSLSQDITVGLQNAKVLVICVSDEYLKSEPCMMEARFGSFNMQLPLVVCVVGTGKDWKMSEVSLMVQKQGDFATVVKLQKKNTGTYDQVVEHVKKFLERPETSKQKRIREKLAKLHQKQEQMIQEDVEKQLKQQGDNKFSFQEEVELIQRKFLRHVTMMIRGEGMSNDLPKLLVFDFIPVDPTPEPQPVDDMGSQASLAPAVTSSISFGFSKAPSKRAKSGKVREKAEDFRKEKFCVKLLCEDEQGWHVEGNPLSLANLSWDEISRVLRSASPYLARLYAVLKQSSVQLNCLKNSQKAEQFMDFIRKEGIETKNLKDAYVTIQTIVAEHNDQEAFTSQLSRCYQQTGKISWLCSNHHNKTGITLLPAGTLNIHGGTGHLLYEEDILMGEYLSYSSGYQKWKGGMPLMGRRSSNRLLKRDTVMEIKAQDLPVIKDEDSKNNQSNKQGEKPESKDLKPALTASHSTNVQKKEVPVSKQTVELSKQTENQPVKTSSPPATGQNSPGTNAGQKNSSVNEKKDSKDSNSSTSSTPKTGSSGGNTPSKNKKPQPDVKGSKGCVVM